MRRRYRAVARAELCARHLLTVLLLAAISVSPIARAAESSPGSDAPRNADSLQQLRQELAKEQQELQQEQAHIRALEERLSADEAAQARSVDAAPAPDASPNALSGRFSSSGYTLESGDGANVIRFRGNVSIDGRYFTDTYTPASADTWLVRRLRPTLEGTLEGSFNFRFMPDFAQGRAIVQDAWGDVRIEPWLVFQFGKFKAPVGLERLQLEQFARFIEVSLPSDLVPYRDLGVKVGGTLGRGVLTYDVGTFDGAIDGGSTDGNPVPDQNSNPTGKFTTEGRVFARPLLGTAWLWLHGLGVGIAATYVNADGVATPLTTTSLLATYKTPGQQPMFSYRGNTATGGQFNNATIAQGVERRIVPQFYYYYRAWGLLGEYVSVDQQVARHLSPASVRSATLTNTAWQVQAAWFLTGEDEAYASATPRRNFDFGRGGPGAWELIARYHEIRFDSQAFTGGAASFANPQTSPGSARAVGTGINWYLNPNFKVQLDYEVTQFEGGAVNGNRPDERVLTSQFALIF